MIGCARFFRPLIWTIELFNEPLRQKSLKISQEDDVVLAMEVDPAAVAVLGIMALHLAGCHAVENLVERLTMNIAKSNVEILAKWYITVAVDDKAAHDALAGQPQMSVTPLVVECYEVEVFLRLVDARRNLADEVRGRQQFARCVEECHCAVDADADVYIVMLGNINNIRHVIKVVPRREAEHQRQRHLVLQCLHHLNHPVIAVTPSHPLVSLAAAVERDVQVPGLIETDGIYDTTGRETVR